jgi:hypothetical protein
MAQRESKRAQTSTSILRQREEYRGLGGPEELHHQQVKKKRNEIFSYFSSSNVYELLPTSRTRRGKSYLTHRLSYFFFSFWLLCLCQLNRGTLKEKIAAL